MTLVRILDDDCTDELRQLLEGASAVPPMPGHVHDRLQDYALGLAAGVATTAALGAGTAQAAQAGLFGKAVGAVMGAPLAAKLALGTVVFAATTTLGYVASGPLIERRQATVVQVSRSATRPAVRAGSAPMGRPVGPAVAEPERGTVLAPRVSAPSSTATSVSAPAAGVAEEARMLEMARGALASSPAEALAIADEHAVRFPRGQLGAEREFIAIDALMRLGRTGEAARRAEPRLRQAPGSLYARRLRQLLGGEE